MASLIRFLLLNFPLTFLVLGLMAGAISLWRRPRPLAAATVVEELIAWFLLFSIGISYFVNFLAHTIFGRVSARFIGWEVSPFQAELGWASPDSRSSASSRSGEACACGRRPSWGRPASFSARRASTSPR